MFCIISIHLLLSHLSGLWLTFLIDICFVIYYYIGGIIFLIHTISNNVLNIIFMNLSQLPDRSHISPAKLKMEAVSDYINFDDLDSASNPQRPSYKMSSQQKEESKQHQDGWSRSEYEHKAAQLKKVLQEYLLFVEECSHFRVNQINQLNQCQEHNVIPIKDFQTELRSAFEQLENLRKDIEGIQQRPPPTAPVNEFNQPKLGNSKISDSNLYECEITLKNLIEQNLYIDYSIDEQFIQRFNSVLEFVQNDLTKETINYIRLYSLQQAEMASIIRSRILQIEARRVALVQSSDLIKELMTRKHTIKGLINKIDQIQPLDADKIILESNKIKIEVKRQKHFLKEITVTGQFQQRQHKLIQSSLLLLKQLEKQIEQILKEGQLIGSIIIQHEQITQYEQKHSDFQHQYQNVVLQYKKQNKATPLEEFHKLKQSQYYLFKLRAQLMESFRQLNIKVDCLGFKMVLNEYQLYMNHFTQQSHNNNTCVTLLSEYFEDQDNIHAEVESLISSQIPKFSIQNPIWTEQALYDEYDAQITLISDKFQEYSRKYDHNLAFMQKLQQHIKISEQNLSILSDYIKYREALQTVNVLSYPQYQIKELPYTDQLILIIVPINRLVQRVNHLQECNIVNTLSKIADRGFDYETIVDLMRLKDKIAHDQDDERLCLQYINVALEFFNRDPLVLYTETKTYKELELKIANSQELHKLKHDDELGTQLYDLFYLLFNSRLEAAFKMIFEYLYNLSLGPATLDASLSQRIDLIYEIAREDMNNMFVVQNQHIISQIQDNAEIRFNIRLMKQFFQAITKWLSLDINNLIEQQHQIIQVITEYQQQLPQEDLYNIQPILKVQLGVQYYPQSVIIQEIINIGLVLKNEYQLYLQACRKRIQSLTQGALITFDTQDQNILQKIQFISNGQQIHFTEIETHYPIIYRDLNSVILKKSAPLQVINQLLTDRGIKCHLNEQGIDSTGVIFQ